MLDPKIGADFTPVEEVPNHSSGYLENFNISNTNPGVPRARFLNIELFDGDLD